MYSVCKLKLYDIKKLLQVSDILYQCGKDLVYRYNLHHWNNSHPKNWLIVLLCAFKNDIYLVFDQKMPIATFQTRITKDGLLFQKLATVPNRAGKGVGSFCLNEIERICRGYSCPNIICEVYDQSTHAIEFYKHKGFCVYGVEETLKYNELKMIRKL